MKGLREWLFATLYVGFLVNINLCMLRCVAYLVKVSNSVSLEGVVGSFRR